MSKVRLLNALNRRGAVSLLEVVVMAALVGVVGAAFAKSYLSNLRFALNLELRTNLEAGRQTVLRASCDDTLPSDITNLCRCTESPAGEVTCPQDSYFPLRGKGGNILIDANSSDGTQAGSWWYRFNCTPQRFIVERAKRLGAKSAGFARDPATREELGWAPLFPKGTMLCAEKFPGTGNPKPKDSSNCELTMIGENSVIPSQCAGKSTAGAGETFCSQPYFKSVDFSGTFKSTPQVMVSFRGTAGNGRCIGKGTSAAPTIIPDKLQLPVTGGYAELNQNLVPTAGYKPFGDHNNEGFDRLETNAVNVTADGFTLSAGASPMLATCEGNDGNYFPIEVSWVAIGCKL